MKDDFWYDGKVCPRMRKRSWESKKMLLIHARYLFVLLIASRDEGKTSFAADEEEKKLQKAKIKRRKFICKS